MPLEIAVVPCLSDNYAYIIGDPDTGTAAVVDVPEAAPINAELARRGWTLAQVLLTHHHPDHVQGLADLTGVSEAQVIGAAADVQRLPVLDTAASEGDVIDVCQQQAHVIDVSGHTQGHIAFHIPALNAVFTADSLMALGCGRLFEGTPAQMHASLGKLAALPDDTIVYSGHEYTATNAAFALTIEPGNPALISRAKDVKTARAAGQPTVPSPLALERATNPFLRSHVPQIAEHLGMIGASPVEVFTEIRKRRDGF